jgi:hypothetical protein
MTSMATNDLFFLQALGSITNGQCTLPIFKALGITNVAALLGHASTYAAALVIDDSELNTLHVALEAAGVAGHAAGTSPKWTSNAANGLRYLRTIVMAARPLVPIEAAAVAAAATHSPSTTLAAGPSATTAPTAPTADALAAVGQRQYLAAGKVYGTTGNGSINMHADHQIKYELVGRIEKGFKSMSPFSVPLGEYSLQLNVAAGKDETYTAFGKTWVQKEGSEKTIKIEDEATLEQQMLRRADANAVAGLWDFPTHRAAATQPAPSATDMVPSSKLLWIDTGAIQSMNAFATVAGQRVEVEKMKEFRRRHPHISAAKFATTIDAGIQRAKANSILKGMSADAAVFDACVKSPENYSLSLAEAANGNGGSGDGVQRPRLRRVRERHVHRLRGAEQLRGVGHVPGRRGPVRRWHADV